MKLLKRAQFGLAALAVAMTAVMAACHGNPTAGPTGVASATSTTVPSPSQDAAKAGSGAPGDPKGASTTARATGPKPAPTDAGPSGSTSSAHDERRSLRYRVRATQSPANIDNNLLFDVAYSRVPTGGIDTVWTQRNSNREVRARHVVRTELGLAGAYFVGDVGDWQDCDWRPQPLLVPRALDLSRTWSLDSTCDHTEGSVPKREHLSGTLKITATKQIAVDGRAQTAWVVHREWTEETTDVNSGSKSTGRYRSDAWWAPDIQEFVQETVDGVFDFYQGPVTIHGEATREGLAG
ncbi:MAG TPA: hypothetical protein VGO92_05430 [Acidimicrobiales bacterium]|nr:hypothetical protein [Acidimicrobiales bacterium]